MVAATAVLIVLLSSQLVLAQGSPPSPLCMGRYWEPECWVRLARPPDCYFWEHELHSDLTKSEYSISWSGKCVDGRTHGSGILDWSRPKDGGGKRGRGSFHSGKRVGRWDEYSYGGVHAGRAEGPYVDGKRHGNWRHDSGGWFISEGPYVNGEEHGFWTERNNEGPRPTVEEGLYVDGERHGRWVQYEWLPMTHEKGKVVAEAEFVNGEGKWVDVE